MVAEYEFVRFGTRNCLELRLGIAEKRGEGALTRAQLVAKVDDLDPEGSALVLSLLDRISSSEAHFADGVQEFTASQVRNEIIPKVSALQIAIDDAEFGPSRAERGS